MARTLRNSVHLGRIAHAYLFCGPRGVGKTSAARILAKAVNCLNADHGEPCTTCENCRAIQEGRAIDIVEMDAASNRGIDEIREIRERVGFAPAVMRYKFYILDEAHMLTSQACNALLKTLEEPPPHVVFILSTTDPRNLPETILSRCQRLEFRRIRTTDAVERLRFICEQEEIEPGPGLLDLIARYSDGSLRDAEGALDQIIAYAGSRPTLEDARAVLGAAGPDAAREIIASLIDGQPQDALRAVNRLVDAGVDPRQVALDLIETLRGLLLLRTSEGLSELVDLGPEALRELRALVPHLSAPRLVALIRAFTPGAGTRGGLRPQLPLELSVVEAAEILRSDPRPLATPSPSDHSSRHPAPQPAEPAARIVERRAEPTPPPAPSTPPATTPELPPTLTEETGPVPAAVPAQAGILFHEVQRRWAEILDACGARNRSVQALLRAGQPIGAEGDALVIGFPYEFHRERIDDVKNRAVVEDTIARVIGQKIHLRCVMATRDALVAQDPLEAAMQDPLVKAAIALGAQVRRVTEDHPEEKP